MIVFDKKLLENTFLLNRAEKLNEQGFVPKSQLQEIKSGLPVLKSQNNILIRIGFFILGCLLYASFVGVISLFSMPLIDSSFWIILFLYTIIGVVLSEFLAREHKQFGYGLDDAFILGFQGFFCATVGVAFDDGLAAFVALFFIGLIACIRYVHTLSLLLSLIGLTGTICYAVIEMKVVDAGFLPFLLLTLSLILYFIYNKSSKLPKYDYHENLLMLLQAFSLALGYFSMNYLAVRELSESLLGLRIEDGQDIPFAFLFYGFTFLIPVFYIIYSLYSKDKLMMVIGFLTFGFSIYTIRFYYHILPIEIALLLAGIVLFAGACFAIYKLKDKQTGITFKAERGSNNDILPNIEALIVSTQIDLKSTETQGKMPFGGGGFSGGGAGDGF